MKMLRDRLGVYGVAGDSGREPRIVTRADCVDSTRDRIAYQMILPNHSAFKHTNEQKLYRATHRRLLAEAGLGGVDWESFHGGGPLARAQQDRLRRTYFGLGKCAARMLNRSLAEGLAAADPNVLRVVRRYPIRFRAQLYTACCQLGVRATQFCETFPVLALLFFTRQFRGENLEETRAMRDAGKRMILRGERVPRIAAIVGFSMIFRRVKPGAAEQAVVTEVSDELLTRYLPRTLAGQRRWFAAVSRASQFGSGFMEWTARCVGHFAGPQKETLAALNDISDWVKASRLADNDGIGLPSRQTDAGCDFITRPFRKDMSVRTVVRLSRGWHEAVAAGMRDSLIVRFPEPWLRAGNVDGFGITPIADSRALYLEGKSLHHCIATYADDILRGDTCVYSVQRGTERVATVALSRRDEGIRLAEIRAACNSRPDRPCERAIQQWFRSQRPVNAPATPSRFTRSPESVNSQ